MLMRRLLVLVCLLLVACGSGLSKEEQQYFADTKSIMDTYTPYIYELDILEKRHDSSDKYNVGYQNERYRLLTGIATAASHFHDLTPPARFSASHEYLIDFADEMKRAKEAHWNSDERAYRRAINNATRALNNANSEMKKLV